MHKHKLRTSVVRAAAVGAAALSATLIVGAGVASAASAPSDPSGGATPVAPHFYNGNVEGIRDTGSDTTFFMMQKIGDLYTGAGLYGCTLQLERRSDSLQLERSRVGYDQRGVLLPRQSRTSLPPTSTTTGTAPRSPRASTMSVRAPVRPSSARLCPPRCPWTSPGRRSPPRAARPWWGPATPRTACRSSPTRSTRRRTGPRPRSAYTACQRWHRRSGGTGLAAR